jgi:hypothetical protein
MRHKWLGEEGRELANFKLVEKVLLKLVKKGKCNFPKMDLTAFNCFQKMLWFGSMNGGLAADDSFFCPKLPSSLFPLPLASLPSACPQPI